MGENLLRELAGFIRFDARLDARMLAAEHIVGLTGNKNSLKLLIAEPEILASLITLIRDEHGAVSRHACLSLINISADKEGATALLNINVSEYCPDLPNPPNSVINELLKQIFNMNSFIADQCSIILSNITRNSHLINKIVDVITEDNDCILKVINIFLKDEFNKNGHRLHNLGLVLGNLSQSHIIRMILLNKENRIMPLLLPFTDFKDSLTRRRGAVATVKNCCFQEDYHEWLLSNKIDILPYLLLPLAGNEEFDDEDNDKLPIELQYLSQDKVREEDPDIRFMLLEALTLLVTRRLNREYIRSKNAYVILREYHKWEKEQKNLLACEHLVNILIRTEDEIAKDNLRDVEIPVDLQERFNQENYQKPETSKSYKEGDVPVEQQKAGEEKSEGIALEDITE